MQMTDTTTMPEPAAVSERLPTDSFEDGPQYKELEVTKTVKVSIQRWTDATPPFPVLETVARMIAQALMQNGSCERPTDIHLSFINGEMEVTWFNMDEHPSEAEALAMWQAWQAAGGKTIDI
jgi:hypothetical protein